MNEPLRIRPRISILVNTCNEADLLPECLASVKGWADEIVVCDMQSADTSADTARYFGAQVWFVPRSAAPEPEARTFGIAKCTGDWVFVLDPDMRLSDRLKQRLDEVVSCDEADMVDLHCRNFYLGRWCSHGHGSQPVFRKFFKRSAFRPEFRNIQTFWHDSLTGRVISLGTRYSIDHYAYRSVGRMIETLSRYASKEARDAYVQGRRFTALSMFWRPTKRLFGNLILRRAFLDGLPGWIVSILVSWYLFLVEVHLWELSSKAAETDEGANAA